MEKTTRTEMYAIAFILGIAVAELNAITKTKDYFIVDTLTAKKTLPKKLVKSTIKERGAEMRVIFFSTEDEDIERYKEF